VITMKTMKLAGSMLIMKKGFVLGVSRKTNLSSFGLPAGKAEPGESAKQAAIRETYEETGVIVNDCVHIFKREEDGFEAHCYYATDWEEDSNWKHDEEGKVEWITPFVLTNKTAAFPEYNKKAIMAFIEILLHRDKTFEVERLNLLSLAYFAGFTKAFPIDMWYWNKN